MYRYFVKDKDGGDYESFVSEWDALDYIKVLMKLQKRARDYFYIIGVSGCNMNSEELQKCKRPVYCQQTISMQ